MRTCLELPLKKIDYFQKTYPHKNSILCTCSGFLEGGLQVMLSLDSYFI